MIAQGYVVGSAIVMQDNESACGEILYTYIYTYIVYLEIYIQYIYIPHIPSVVHNYKQW